MPERALPTGTITFLFSDIEGSTRLTETLGPGAFRELLERHNAILRAAIERHGGTERGTQGDSFLVLFSEAPAALAAAVEAQRALHVADWPAGAVVRVRMGLHSGLGTLGGDDYVGVDVNRAARIAGAAHGGQVVLSEAARALVADHLPDGVGLVALGEHELRDLRRPEVLHQAVIDELPATFPPLRSSRLRIDFDRLPERLTSFIGRERELAEIGRLLQTARLVTLVGPGGTGKTSLAVELARSAAGRYADGAWFVPLEGVTDPALVPGALAAGFGLASASGPVEERLARFLGDRSAIVVIDNFEQVLSAAPLLPGLLRSAAGVTFVVTSRAPLRVAGEQEYPVAPLAVPDGIAAAAGTDALRLFEDRAARVRPGYRLEPGDLEAVVRICRLLDGLPLGIELAASRMSLLPAREIAERLARRLDLPGAGGRDLPERQRTLQAAIAWSHDLLAPAEQRLLERLSVFAGSFGLTEAEAVVGDEDAADGDLLAGIAALADHHLLQPVASEHGVRFRLLATVRMFAGARLDARGETAALRRRHAATYLALAEGIAPRIPGRGQRPLLDRLAEDHDNLRAAVDWAIAAGNAETGLRLVSALWRYWQGGGHVDEGRTATARVLAIPGAGDARPARLGALDAAGGMAWWQGDVEAADRFYAEQVELARQLGDPHALAFALSNLSHTRVLGDDPEAGRAIRAEAIRLYEQTGDPRGAARVEWIDANELMRTDPPASRVMLERLVQRYIELEDDFYVGMASGSLSWTLIALGAYEPAIEHAMRGLRVAFELGDIASATISVREIEILVDFLGDDRSAAVLEGAFSAMCSRYGIATPAGFEVHVRRLWPGPASLRERLGDEAYESLLAQGRTMGIDELRAFMDEAVVRLAARNAVGIASTDSTARPPA